MLYLNFALNLESLADKMIGEINACWTDPFTAPVVIFPDPKLEQWFRLRWVKKHGTIAGFNSMMIDRFLTETLIGDDDEKKKLHADMLRNVILAYLYQHKGELGELDPSGEMLRYLIGDNGELDENHLFDFAGKMASLFLEYETSRPAKFVSGKNDKAEGILDCWKDGKPRDFFDASPREVWQRNLYSKIFHKNGAKQSLLDKVFENLNARHNEGKARSIHTEYLTIPYLFEESKKNGFKCDKFTDASGKILPVFLFGLTGMGQFYRVILEEYARSKERNIHAYIQNPCMEFWEDLNTKDHLCRWKSVNNAWTASDSNRIHSIQEKMSVKLQEDDANPEDYDTAREKWLDADENALLCYWGKSGRDNIRLWCNSSDYEFTFDETPVEELKDDATLLHTIQYMIATRTNKSKKLLELFNKCKDGFKEDASLSLTAAPTRVREMEILHSRICKLMEEGARVDDILVVSPCLDDYRTAIYQVFDQNSHDNGLHVPFAIVDSPAKASLTEDALETLFNIMANGTILRPNFFMLVKNPVVQNARGITDEDVDAWISWIDKTHAYRNRGAEKENWKDCVRRLLLSRFSGNNVQFADSELMPYSDINSDNDRCLEKFADCIDDLEKWIDQKNSAPDLATLEKSLYSWLGMKDIPKGFGGETIVLKNIVAEFENLHIQKDTGFDALTWNCVYQSLRTAAQSSKYSCGSLFVNGITFAGFIPNRIIPIKHLFFIGADSGSFPGTKPTDTMDLRKARPWPGDDSPIAKGRYAFLCQFMSTSKSFHISYLCKDVSKDEDFYPSSVVHDIRNFLKKSLQETVLQSGKKKEEWLKEPGVKENLKNIWPATKISLDENRSYNELFTDRGIRNRNLFNSMLAANSGTKHKQSAHIPPKDEQANDTSKPEKLPERVTINQLKNFLTDPFEFRISQMMQDTDTNENDIDPEEEALEPIDFTHLGKAVLTKNVLAADISPDAQEGFENLEKEMQANKLLPDGIFKEKLLQAAKDRAESIKTQMEAEEDSPLHDNSKWNFHSKIGDIVFADNDVKWTLSGTLDWTDGNNLVSITSMEQKSPATTPYFKTSKYLGQYLGALALIAGRTGDNSESINIAIYSSNPKSSKPSRATVTATPEQARQRLQSIYDLAFKKRYSKAVPVDLFDQNIENFSDFSDKLDDAWNYFGKKNLFDKRRDIGFTVDATFLDQWNTAKKQQSELLSELTIHKAAKKGGK